MGLVHVFQSRIGRGAAHEDWLARHRLLIIMGLSSLAWGVFLLALIELWTGIAVLTGAAALLNADWAAAPEL